MAVLKLAPSIAAATAKLLEAVSKTKNPAKPAARDNRPKDLDELKARIEKLEVNDAQLAELVSQLVGHSEQLTRRTNIMFLATIGTAAVAVAALLLTVL